MIMLGIGISIGLEEYGQMSARLRDDLLIIKEAELEQTKRQMDSARRGR